MCFSLQVHGNVKIFQDSSLPDLELCAESNETAFTLNLKNTDKRNTEEKSLTATTQSRQQRLDFLQNLVILVQYKNNLPHKNLLN